MMKTLSFLLFFSLTSQSYGQRSSNEVYNTVGGPGSGSSFGSGEFGSGVGSAGYNFGYGGSMAAGLPGGTLGAPTGAGSGFGAEGGSSSYGGSYRDRHSVGSHGGTIGDMVGAGAGSGNEGLGGAVAGSPVGPLGAIAGNGVESSNSGSLARRRQRARVAGAVVGTALGGLVLGGLIAHLAKLGREGRLGHIRSSSYGSYDLGYGYSNDYGSRMAYRGYRRRCNNGRCRQRTCVGLQCY
ncbi:uncharacterized protein LOC144150939 isoform X2 [Haemaphysalis longicornis]